MRDAERQGPERSQVEWQTTVHEIEKQVETLTDALDSLRIAVRRLSLAHLAVVEPGLAAVPPALDLVPDDAATDQARRAIAESRVANGKSLHAQAEEAAAAAREEFRRNVEGNNPGLSEGSWPVRAPRDGSADEDRGGLSESSWPVQSPRDGGTERDQVRRAVEEARAELGSGPLSADEPGLSTDDSDMARDEVRRAVEQARAELDIHPPSSEEPADADAARDEVRRAVERTRAELKGGWSGHNAETPANEDHAARTDVGEASPYASALAANGPIERSSQTTGPGTLNLPPTLVIEDHEGRVELARVYETLIRLDCAGQASLLNYTPHSVSVGLSPMAPRLSDELLTSAVKAVFGRDSTVVIDGARISVQIVADRGKVA